MGQSSDQALVIRNWWSISPEIQLLSSESNPLVSTHCGLHIGTCPLVSACLCLVTAYWWLSITAYLLILAHRCLLIN